MPDTKRDERGIRTADMSSYKTARDSDDMGSEVDYSHDRERPMYWGATQVLRNPLFWVIAMLTPIFIWFTLFGIKPNFITIVDNNGATVVSHQNLLLWTIVFTIIIWLIVYFAFYACMACPSRGQSRRSKRSM